MPSWLPKIVTQGGWKVYGEVLWREGPQDESQTGLSQNVSWVGEGILSRPLHVNNIA